MSLLEAALSRGLLAELEAWVDARVDEKLARLERRPPKRWLSVAEAGDYFGGRSVRAMYQCIKREQIPTHAVKRVDGRVLVDRLALDRLLEES